MTESRFDYHCIDCAMNLMLEWFMVHDSVWRQTGLGSYDGCLCIGCVEARIGRTLRLDDFPQRQVNEPDEFMSDRFLNRLGLRAVWIDGDGNEVVREVAQPMLASLDNPPARGAVGQNPGDQE